MNNLLKKVTLTAAAIVAALVVAPTSEARVVVRVGPGVGPRLYAPVRVVRPGPRYVLVEEGWVLPPYAGAVWIPGHRDAAGFWIGGHWRV